MIQKFLLQYRSLIAYNINMIEFEILKTPDSQRIGKYKFFENTIIIGSSPLCQVFIPNDDLMQEHITIKIDGVKLYLYQKDDHYCHVNNMRTTGRKTLKLTDIIKINNTELKLLNFLEEKYKTRKQYLNDRINEIEETDKDLIPLLQKLSETDEEFF